MGDATDEVVVGGEECSVELVVVVVVVVVVIVIVVVVEAGFTEMVGKGEERVFEKSMGVWIVEDESGAVRDKVDGIDARGGGREGRSEGNGTSRGVAPDEDGGWGGRGLEGEDESQDVVGRVEGTDGGGDCEGRIVVERRS